ncbi:MAG: hypothetical protein H2066_03445 [Candidatus Poseidoniales archaeon]|nr:hypothetical protein [Candidatus Poseidoniales archaeon]
MVETRFLINSIGPILMLLYAGYCWVHQGCFHKGKGWRTREESPKMFWFNIVLMILFSILAFLGNIFAKW